MEEQQQQTITISEIQKQNAHLAQEDMQRLEIKHQDEVLVTFQSYSELMKQVSPSIELLQPHSANKRVEKNAYYKIVKERRGKMLEEAIHCNQQFLNDIVMYCEGEERLASIKQEAPVSFKNFSKIKTTIKQFYREWCSDSPELKDYRRMVQKAREYLQPQAKVLAPGSGLGRLVLEFVEAGFGCQGNEVSYFMLYGSNFILNSVESQNQYRIYPFISSSGYYEEEEDIFRSVLVPDKAACEVIPSDSDFSMSAGEFTEVYSSMPLQFDCVATCFFIDTANNVFDYIDTISKTLRPNGYWINFGPLLFHYRQMFSEVSIEVSWQTLKVYIQERFEFLEEEVIETSYCHDPRAQMGVTYQCLMFVCRKKAESS